VRIFYFNLRFRVRLGYDFEDGFKNRFVKNASKMERGVNKEEKMPFDFVQDEFLELVKDSFKSKE
jgi:hypothetical protein